MIYLVKYPFDCAEQRASRILALASLRDVLAAFKSKEYKAVLDKSFQGYARPAYLQ